jgi:hypothetical protein
MSLDPKTPVFLASFMLLFLSSVFSQKNSPDLNQPKLSTPNIKLSTNQSVITCTLPVMKGYPGITFDISDQNLLATNASIGGYAIKLRNSNNQDLRLFARIDDVHTTGKPAAWQASFKLLSESDFTKIRIPLPSSFHGMQLPPPEVFGPWQAQVNTYGPPPDEKNLVSLTLFSMNPTSPVTFEISEISAIPAPNLNGLVDRYGQNSRTNWPGKIQDLRDFAKQREDEEAMLEKWEDNPEDSTIAKLIQPSETVSLRATGFFRTALIQNNEEIEPRRLAQNGETAHWWFVTPDGKLFFSMGMNCVNFGEDTTTKNREYLFQWLPDESKVSGKVNFFQLNLRRKYGSDWKNQFMDITFHRLSMWGFNTLGNWCDPVFYAKGKMPYTKTLGYKKPPLIHESCALPDFFHPDFEANLREGIAKGTESCREDPLLIGYFVDNELHWDNWENDGLADQSTVARATLAAPAKTPARKVFIQQLQERYKSLNDFNKAWNFSWNEWSEQQQLQPVQLTVSAREDCRLFLKGLASNYYSTVAKVVKEADGNHLYLGSRLAQRPSVVVEAASGFCDVISFNCYDDSIEPSKWSFLYSFTKPAMIGEFHFTAPDLGMFPGRKTRLNQQEKLKARESYVKSVLNTKTFIGAHWFQYVDQPLTGRWFDSENYEIGFIGVTDL